MLLILKTLDSIGLTSDVENTIVTVIRLSWSSILDKQFFLA